MSSSSSLALVTGASSGIGKAYAEALASRGFDLIAIGRRQERLDELKRAFPDVAVEPLVADLATDEGVAAVAELAGSRPLTMLINNAGVAHYKPFAELSADEAAELLSGAKGQGVSSAAGPRIQGRERR
jgi:uncharacterized protein